ncbi:substrate-binding periplasmic protein [Desulfonema magnum]|uniref:ABC-transporter, substrate-binding protein n=1 Tax=Desulfonema magnum TaxID=45655 RepID=A0A975BFJ3_9BACT|nr:transporter substrate-binding domain-containing protein [Desulfonema magnum]QTA84383.1 putative ABC-transporter, substrate-binding protein [Desulfonema magnum]
MNFIFICLIAGLFALSAQAQNQTPKKSKIILTTQNVSPYVIVDKNGTFKGYAANSVQYALKKMKRPYEIKIFPWNRAQMMVKRDMADGFFPASQNNIRDEYAVISETIAEQKWNWYMLKSNPSDPADPLFKEKATVGGFMGTNMLQWLKKNNYNIKGNPNNSESLLKMLLNKRIDAILANNMETDEIIKNEKIEDRFKVITLKDKPMGIYFSKIFLKKNPCFLKKFNKYVHEYRSGLLKK